MQVVIVTLAVLLSLGYASWRIRRAFQKPADPCAGCVGCPLKGQKKECDSFF